MKKIRLLILVTLLLFTVTFTVSALTIKGQTYPGSIVTLDGDRTIEFGDDPQGKFVFEGVEKGEHRIKIENPDFKTKELNFEINSDTDLGKIFLEPGSGFIAGTILYDNKKLSNVKVKLIDLDKSVKTDEEGNFSFKNIPATYDSGPHKVVLEHEKFGPQESKVYVSHNRLTILNKEIEARPGKIYGHTSPGTEIIIGGHITKADQKGEFEHDIKPGSYEVEVKRTGYIPFVKKINLKADEELDLGEVDLGFKNYVDTSFQEDAWLGAYFLDDNLKEKYYPFLNIRRRRINKKDPDSVIKLILSNYIIARNTLTAEKVNSGESIEVLRKKDPLLIDRELYLLNFLKKEVEDLYQILKNYSGYKYRFYHFKLSKKRKDRDFDESLLVTEKLVNETSPENKRFSVPRELFKESRDTTQIINDMLPGEYENLIEYTESPLVSLEGETKKDEDDLLKIARISYIEFGVEDIGEIVNFFEPFKKDLIKTEDLKLDEWLKWEEVTDE